MGRNDSRFGSLHSGDSVWPLARSGSKLCTVYRFPSAPPLHRFRISLVRCTPLLTRTPTAGTPPQFSPSAAPSPSAPARPRRLKNSATPPRSSHFGSALVSTACHPPRGKFDGGGVGFPGGAVEQIFGSHLTVALLIQRRECSIACRFPGDDIRFDRFQDAYHPVSPRTKVSARYAAWTATPRLPRSTKARLICSVPGTTRRPSTKLLLGLSAALKASNHVGRVQFVVPLSCQGESQNPTSVRPCSSRCER
jgi:hypothetical protein